MGNVAPKPPSTPEFQPIGKEIQVEKEKLTEVESGVSKSPQHIKSAVKAVKDYGTQLQETDLSKVPFEKQFKKESTSISKEGAALKSQLTALGHEITAADQKIQKAQVIIGKLDTKLEAARAKKAANADKNGFKQKFKHWRASSAEQTLLSKIDKKGNEPLAKIQGDVKEIQASQAKILSDIKALQTRQSAFLTATSKQSDFFREVRGEIAQVEERRDAYSQKTGAYQKEVEKGLKEDIKLLGQQQAQLKDFEKKWKEEDNFTKIYEEYHERGESPTLNKELESFRELKKSIALTEKKIEDTYRTNEPKGPGTLKKVANVFGFNFERKGFTKFSPQEKPLETVAVPSRPKLPDQASVKRTVAPPPQITAAPLSRTQPTPPIFTTAKSASKLLTPEQREAIKSTQERREKASQYLTSGAGVSSRKTQEASEKPPPIPSRGEETVKPTPIENSEIPIPPRPSEQSRMRHANTLATHIGMPRRPIDTSAPPTNAAVPRTRAGTLDTASLLISKDKWASLSSSQKATELRTILSRVPENPNLKDLASILPTMEMITDTDPQFSRLIKEGNLGGLSLIKAGDKDIGTQDVRDIRERFDSFLTLYAQEIDRTIPREMKLNFGKRKEDKIPTPPPLSTGEFIQFKKANDEFRIISKLSQPDTNIPDLQRNQALAFEMINDHPVTLRETFKNRSNELLRDVSSTVKQFDNYIEFMEAGKGIESKFKSKDKKTVESYLTSLKELVESQKNLEAAMQKIDREISDPFQKTEALVKLMSPQNPLQKAVFENYQKVIDRSAETGKAMVENEAKIEKWYRTNKKAIDPLLTQGNQSETAKGRATLLTVRPVQRFSYIPGLLNDLKKAVDNLAKIDKTVPESLSVAIDQSLKNITDEGSKKYQTK